MNKQRNWAWFLIYLLPVLSLFAVILFNDFTYADFSSGMFMTNVLSRWFAYFAVNPFDSTFQYVVQDVMGIWAPQFLFDYASYLISVFMVRLLYEVLVFLPKWVISFIERWNKK